MSDSDSAIEMENGFQNQPDPFYGINMEQQVKKEI